MAAESQGPPRSVPIIASVFPKCINLAPQHRVLSSYFGTPREKEPEVLKEKLFGEKEKCCVLKLEMTGSPGARCHGGGHVWWDVAGRGKAAWPHSCMFLLLFGGDFFFPPLGMAEAETPPTPSSVFGSIV